METASKEPGEAPINMGPPVQSPTVFEHVLANRLLYQRIFSLGHDWPLKHHETLPVHALSVH